MSVCSHCGEERPSLAMPDTWARYHEVTAWYMRHNMVVSIPISYADTFGHHDSIAEREHAASEWVRVVNQGEESPHL